MVEPKTTNQPLQDRVAAFCMHVDNSLYAGTENQPSPAHSSLIKIVTLNF